MISVLHIFSGDLWAGAEVVIFTVLQQLARRSSTRVLALALNEGILAKKLREAGVRVLVISETEHSMMGIVRLARRYLRSETIHIVHTHRYKENLIGWLLSMALKVPYRIATLHGMPEAPVMRGKDNWKTTLIHAIDRAVLRLGFARIVAVSRDMATLLTQSKAFRQTQLCVIHNGIAIPPLPKDRGSSVLCTEKRAFKVGTSCRLVPVKGLDLFLDIAKGVTRQSPHVQFSILGEGPLRSYLEEQIQVLGLQEVINILPLREDPISYYRSLDLYINTSVHEGIPCSVLEAMGCSIPIVAPFVGGIPEIVTHGETGLLVADRKPEAFVDAIHALERDPDLRMNMGLKARGVIESRFSDIVVGNSYATLYHSLVTA